MTDKQLQSAGTAMLALFVAACGLMHVIQPERSPLNDAVSYYMNGSMGWLMGAGIVCLGAASLLLLARIHRATAGRTSRTALTLLFIWGAGCVVAGLAPPDPPGQWEKPPSVSGLAHGIAALFAFSAFPVGALLVSGTWPEPKPRRSLKAIALLGAVTTVIFFACLTPAFRNQPPYALGLAERAVLALHVGWLLIANQHTVTRFENNP